MSRFCVLVPQNTEPSDDRVQRGAHFVAERGQKQVFRPVGRFGFAPCSLFIRHQCLAVTLGLFRITANGICQRLVHRLVEPRYVIQVGQVWARFALAPQSKHARAKCPVLRDDRP